MPEQTTLTGPKYPAVKIKLTNMDGNAFVIIGRCRAAARKHNVPNAEIVKFSAEAMSGNYDDMLATCCRWFTCQ